MRHYRYISIACTIVKCSFKLINYKVVRLDYATNPDVKASTVTCADTSDAYAWSIYNLKF